MPLTVRRATTADLAAIAAVATAAWRDTYAGLLRSDTIEAFIERAYSTERLEHRIAADEFLVALEDEAVIAFADAIDEGEHVELLAIYTLPEARGRGAGTQLLAAIQQQFPSKRIAADVLAGNRKGEVFYERRGFAPRETIEAVLNGQPVVERRWWLEPETLS